jgi:hypothetical protein
MELAGQTTVDVRVESREAVSEAVTLAGLARTVRLFQNR